MALGKISAAAAVFLMLLFSPAYAQTVTNTTCSDDFTSIVNSTIIINNGTAETNTEISEPTYCAFGCNGNTGRCNQSSLTDVADTTVMPFVVAGIGLMLVGVLWRMERPWDVAYKVVLSFFGVFLVVGGLSIGNSILAQVPTLDASVLGIGESSIVNVATFMYIFIVLLLLFFLIDVIMFLVNWRRSGGQGRGQPR